MFGCLRWADRARNEIKERSQLAEDAIAFCKHSSFVQRDPSTWVVMRKALEERRLKPTLILSVTPLDLFMDTFLNLSFQYPCPSGLVVVCYFENMRCVDPIILATAHDMIPAHIEFIHWDLVDFGQDIPDKRG